MDQVSLVTQSSDAGRALGVHIAAIVESMVNQRLALLGMVSPASVNVIVRQSASNPLRIEFGGQEYLFSLGETVLVPKGLVNVLEAMGKPVYRDLGLGLTGISSGIMFEVV